MNLSGMRTALRRDLHDEDSAAYRWTDDELDRHIAHAVTEFSQAMPLEQKATIATTAGVREIDLSSLSGRVMVEAVEYPAGRYPAFYQRFALWGDVLTLLGDEVPDGGNACVYYGKLHTLNTSTSTIPTKYEDLVATGAAGFAAIEWAAYAVNKVNIGGEKTPQSFMDWGKEKMAVFRGELKRLGMRNRVRLRTLYHPLYPVRSRTTDYGP